MITKINNYNLSGNLVGYYGFEINLVNCKINYSHLNKWEDIKTIKDINNLRECIEENIVEIRHRRDFVLDRLDQICDIRTIINGGCTISKQLTEKGRVNKQAELKELLDTIEYLENYTFKCKIMDIEL